MPRFEVRIPAAPPHQPFALTLRVDAESWLPALKLGLQKICGERLADNVLCDVGDGAVDVTDPATGRTFRIVELPAAGAPPRQPSAAATPPAAPPARTPVARTAHELAREEILADLFLRAPAVRGRDAEGGLAYLLDLAGEKVRCASSAAWVASGDGVLTMAAARGAAPAAAKAGARLAMGTGVPGFCAQEAVALAVSDVDRDPRFRGAAAAPAARSLACAPIAHRGRVLGCLALHDKQGGAFDAGDLAVLCYLAHQAALFLVEREAHGAA